MNITHPADSCQEH